LIKRGLDTDAIQQRFRREREILASLEHPNIARLLDAGTTEEGLSYFVMEYVEGEIISEYCAQRGLTTRERLELFRHVSAAVSYAHQRLVVHRDLKPSNMLVTREGELKLLDFGIAKLLRDEELSGQTIAEQQVLTPKYASPEQIRGEMISTATDVYSLGVVLREVVAEPNGTSETPRRKLGDLVTIIHKATHQEAQRRYSSVAQFSEDLGRYLDGRPVRARPDSLRYRAGKFIARNRVATAAALVVALSVVSALIISLYETGVARRQRDVAQQERNKAQEISRFLQRMLSFSNQSFTSVSPVAQRRDVTVNEMLGQIAPQVERELAHQPDVRAEVLRTIGSSYASQGNYVEAEKQLRAALAGDRQSGEIKSSEAANTMIELGLIKYRELKLDEAERFFGPAVTWYRAQQQTKAKGFDVADLAFALDCLSVNTFFRGDTKKAAALSDEALRLVRNPTDEHGRTVRALATMDTGGMLAMTGDVPRGEPMLKDALAQFHQISDQPRWEMGAALAVLGFAERTKGNFAQATEYLREGEKIYGQTLGEDNFYMEYNLQQQSAVLAVQQRWAEAEKVARRELEIARRIVPAAPAAAAAAQRDLGEILAREGKFAEAENNLREVLPSYIAARDHAGVTEIKVTVSECLLAQQRSPEAEKFALEAREEATACSPPNSAMMTMAEKNLAAVYRSEGKGELAARLKQ